MTTQLRTNDGYRSFSATDVAAICDMADRLVETAKTNNQPSGDWYADAQALVQKLAYRYGLTEEQAAEILAVTSVSCKWEVQVKWVDCLLTALINGSSPSNAPGPFLGKSKRDVSRILAGETNVVQGDKLRAFVRNLLGDTSVVTVDRWAVRAAIGYTPTQSETKRLMKTGTQARAKIDAAYHLAATQMGYTPSALQALVWCVVRG